MTIRDSTVPYRSEPPPLASTVCGADVELANFILGDHGDRDRSIEAAQRVLREVDGVRPSRHAEHTPRSFLDSAAGYDLAAAETTRVWLPANGGCIYIDMGHLELCLPEVSSAFEHVAAWHAMLRIARDAAQRAAGHLDDGESIELVANNSDGRSKSYGGHLDFLVRRATWDAISRKARSLLFLASHHASSVIYTGAGKVGSENGRPEVGLQISQRADFIESLFGQQTTYARPLINTRDEPLCGLSAEGRRPDALARMHVIHCDTGLCHGAQVLKVGVEQIVLAMLAAGREDASLLLDDPVDAVVAWSHDIALARRSMLVSGETVTAVELQRRYFDAAVEAHADGVLDEIPRAGEILALWDDTLTKLAAGDLDALAPRLDWCLKLMALRSVSTAASLDARDVRAKHADLQYAALATDRGLYWAYEDAGFVERYASEADIARYVCRPPRDTRACARAVVLSIFREDVWDADWDFIRVRSASDGTDFDLALEDPRDPGFMPPEEDQLPGEGDARPVAAGHRN